MTPLFMTRRTVMRGMLGSTMLVSQSSFGPAIAQTVDEKPATGTIQYWIAGVDDANKMIEGFKAANPDAEVVVTAIPEGELDKKILTAIATGVVPDLIRVPFVSLRASLSAGGFAPVPEGVFDLSKFSPVALDVGSIDGVRYAIPPDTGVLVLHYRKDLAEAAGVEPPKTWEELKTFGQALQKQGAEFGFGIGVGYDYYTGSSLREYTQQAGGDFLNADQTEWTLNTPAAVTALDFMYGDLIQSKIVSPDGPTFLDSTPWFTSGKIGSQINGVWFRSWLVDANGEEWVKTHHAAAPFPAGPGGNGKMTMTGNGLVVPEQANNPDGAWKLARYITSVEGQVAQYVAAGMLPAEADAWEAPQFKDDAYLHVFKDALEATSAPIMVPTWGEVATIVGKQMEYVARGEKTAQEALDEAQRQAERIGVE